MILKKSHSIFFIPFKITKNLSDIDQILAHWWQPIFPKELCHEESAFFLPHVNQFLVGSNDDTSTVTAKTISGIRIYGISSQVLTPNSDNNNDDQVYFWKRFSSARHTLQLDKRQKDNDVLSSFSFVIDGGNSNNTFFSPRLIVYPSMGMGLLSLSFHLFDKDLSVENQQLFNYYMHKISGGTVKCCSPALFSSERVNNDKARERYTSAHNYALSSGIAQPVSQSDNTSGNMYWSLLSLASALLPDMSITNTNRAFVFSYTETTNADKSVALMHTSLMSRCMKSTYHISSSSAVPLFEDILVAASYEGVSIMSLGDNTGNSFASNGLEQRVGSRYVWIYVIALLQHHATQALLFMLSQMEQSRHTISNKQYVKNRNKVLEMLREIKVNCYYTQIGYYSHHNRFYEYCTKALGGAELYRSLQEKLQMVNTLLAIEEQQTKEQQIANNKRQQNRLNFILAFLTFMQLIVPIKEMLCSDSELEIWIYAILFVFLIIFGIVIYNMILRR